LREAALSKRFNIALIALIALTGLWAWTVSHDRANARSKLSSFARQQINTLDVTMKPGRSQHSVDAR
jgi:hypothetical protein